MHKPFWRVDTARFRYGLTGFRIQALVCLIVTITLDFLLRLTAIVWAGAATCIAAHQFWFEPYQNDWPLGGVYFLVFLLLLVWSASIILSQIVRGKTDIFLSVVNFLAIAFLFGIVGPATDQTSLDYDSRTNKFSGWKVTDRYHFFYTENRCELAAPYVGRWKIIEHDLPKYGLSFPELSIEIKQSLKITATDSTWGKPYRGSWRPPHADDYYSVGNRGIGEMYWKEGWSIWTFDLDGDTLTLTTPQFFEWQAPAKVVLQRQLDEPMSGVKSHLQQPRNYKYHDSQ